MSPACRSFTIATAVVAVATVCACLPRVRYAQYIQHMQKHQAPNMSIPLHECDINALLMLMKRTCLLRSFTCNAHGQIQDQKHSHVSSESMHTAWTESPSHIFDVQCMHIDSKHCRESLLVEKSSVESHVLKPKMLLQASLRVPT